MANMDDSQILIRLREGDRDTFRRFYRRTHPKLMAWVQGRIGDAKDTEEIVQDTYLSFLDSLPLFQGKSSLWTFLVSIAKHEVADYWRKRYAKKAILTIPFADHVYTEKLFSSAQTALVIQAIYQKLLPQEVEILKWKYEEDLGVQEIAAKLKISVKAAESRLFRARKAFQIAYELVNAE